MIDMTNWELDESLHQFISIWRLIGSPYKGSDQTSRSNLSLAWSTLPFFFYNAIFLDRYIDDKDELRESIQQAATYMRSTGQIGLFLPCVENLGDVARTNLVSYLTEAGLNPNMPMTGMAGDILPMRSPGHPKLKFVRITDNATIKDFGELNCLAYGAPVETAISILGKYDLWLDHAYGFVAYEDQTPVATATAIVNDGCLFLFLVATHPETQRKGYGEATVRHALQTAHQATGITRTVLHATEAGYPIYLRMGYHPTVKFLGSTLQT